MFSSECLLVYIVLVYSTHIAADTNANPHRSHQQCLDAHCAPVCRACRRIVLIYYWLDGLGLCNCCVAWSCAVWARLFSYGSYADPRDSRGRHFLVN